MEIPDSSTPHVGPQIPPTTISEGTTQKRILLVDDNPVNQKVMAKTLRKLGFKNIEVASDGRMGVNTYNKGGSPNGSPPPQFPVPHPANPPNSLTSQFIVPSVDGVVAC